MVAQARIERNILSHESVGIEPNVGVASGPRLGFGIVSSVQGRGIVDERSPMSLGAFNLHAPVEQFYASCDAMLVVGSRLRSNETLAYKLKLPQPLYRVDVDAAANQRAYPNDLFLQADAALTLSALADRLSGKVWIESSFADELATARAAAERLVRDGLGPYSQLVDVLQAAVGRDFLWVRDVTVSNSTWGNRLPRLAGPRDGVHAMGGGIGQGIQMALGAALAANASGRRRKTVCLSGDGGLMVNVGELATLVQEKADVVVIVMNDRGYGVIKNIQDAIYGGRRYYADLHTPDFAMLAQSIALPHHRITDLAALPGPLAAAIERVGPTLIEIDMTSIGPFARAFAGPPVRKDTNA